MHEFYIIFTYYLLLISINYFIYIKRKKIIFFKIFFSYFLLNYEDIFKRNALSRIFGIFQDFLFVSFILLREFIAVYFASKNSSVDSLFKRFHPFFSFFFLENFERSLTSLQEFFSSSFEDKYRE